MIQLLHANIVENFQDLVQETENQLCLVSPYIGRSTAKRLCEWMNPSVSGRVLITRFSRQDFYSGASSIEGVLTLAEAGFCVKAVRGLHTKLFLFDERATIFGSSNLTAGGLKKNVELNFLVTEEDSVLSQAWEYFHQLNHAISDDSVIGLERIKREKDELDNLGLSPKGLDDRFFSRDWDLGTEVQIGRGGDLIESALQYETTRGISVAAKSPNWLKFEGISTDRVANSQKRIKQPESGRGYTTSFPKKPIGIEPDDILFLAILSYNAADQPMPMIYGYALTDGFDEDNVRSESEKSNYRIFERFPYFVTLRELTQINAPISECIPLVELYNHVGADAFPTTAGTNAPQDRIHQMHFRRDKLRITQAAADYLRDRIDNLVEIHGAI